jgi:hypothetical protein
MTDEEIEQQQLHTRIFSNGVYAGITLSALVWALFDKMSDGVFDHHVGILIVLTFSVGSLILNMLTRSHMGVSHPPLLQ